MLDQQNAKLRKLIDITKFFARKVYDKSIFSLKKVIHVFRVNQASAIDDKTIAEVLINIKL